MKKKVCSKSGFTLIESLIVISILGILLSIGIAAYNVFNRNQILFQTAKNLKGDLRLAQSKALSAEKDCDINVCGGTTAGCGNDNDSSEKTLDGWFVLFSNNSYTIYGSCQGVQFGQKTFDLPNNVSISSPNTIKFQVLTKGVDPATTITINAFDKSQTVTITSTGEFK